jgi:hypothetical protein
MMLLLIFCVGFIPSISADYYFEAEDAAGTPGFSPFAVKEDNPLASGGMYVVNTGSGLSTASDSATGQMHFEFTVDHTCNVSFFVRCCGLNEWAGYNNSMHYKVEGLDADWTYLNNLNRVQFDWHYFAVRTNVPAGTYTLKILRCENGVNLDTFFINLFDEPMLFNDYIDGNLYQRVPESGYIDRLRDVWPARYVEAEDTLGGPVFSPFTVVNDSNAFGDYCITYAGGAVDDTPDNADDGQAWFAFNLDVEEDADVWVRAKLPAAGSDSFWYKLQGADASWLKLENTNTDWSWYKLGSYSDLRRGTWILKLLKREPGVCIDRIFFSVDGSEPQGARSFYIEAEAKENTADFSPLVIGSDDYLAHGHGYIVYGSGAPDTTPDDADPGQAHYTVRVQDHGADVDVWANVLLPTADDDLFYFKLDGVETAWNPRTGTQAAWGWVKLKTYPAVDAGEYTFKLLKGEDGAKIDRLYVCTDGSMPEAQAVPVPGSSARFVAPNVGSDSNDGTAAAPWATLQHAFANLGFAQQLYIREGLYMETDPLALDQDGTESEWCEVKAYPGEEVIIDGSGLTRAETQSAHALVKLNGSYIRVENLNVRKSWMVGIQIGGTPGEVIGCRTDDTWCSGIWWGGKGVRIMNNTVVRPCSFLMDPGAGYTAAQAPNESIHGAGDHFEIAYNMVCFSDKEGIDTLGGSHGRIHHNEVHHLYKFPNVGAIYCDAWNPIEDFEIYDNWLHDNGAGISINSEVAQSIHNIRIHHNRIAYAYWASGIGVSNYGDLEHQTTNVKIWNNTLIDCQQGIGIDSGTNLVGLPNVENVDIRNNIFVSDRQAPISGNAILSNITAAYNLYDVCTYSFVGTDYLMADPLLTDRVYEDYSLLPASPAINSGDPAEKYFDPDLTINDIGAVPTGTQSAELPDPAAEPYPADLSTGFGIDDSVAWKPTTNVDQHRVFLGNAVNPPEGAVLEWNVFHHGQHLDTNTVYFWGVNEENGTGIFPGTLSSFKTEAPKDELIANGDMSEPFLRNNTISGSEQKNDPGWWLPLGKTDSTRWNRDYVNNWAYCDDIGSNGGLLQVIHDQYTVKGVRTFRMMIKNTEGDATANLLRVGIWGVEAGQPFFLCNCRFYGPKWDGVRVGTDLLESANLCGTTFDWMMYEVTIDLGSGFEWIGIELWTENVTPSAGDECFVDDVELTGVNHTPAFGSVPMSTAGAQIGTAYSATLAGSATDADGDPLSYRKISGRAWLNIAADGTLSGTPAAADAGANTFIIETDDGRGKWDQNWLTIDVASSSPQPPMFTADPIYKKDAIAGGPYSNSLAGDAVDANPGDTLTFSKLSGPAWLTVAPDGTLGGIPSETADLGINEFAVQVSDGGYTDTATLYIEVVIGVINTPPAFVSDPILKSDGLVDTDYSGSIAADAVDPDVSDVLTFSKQSGPGWLNVASDGTLSGTPTYADSGLNSFTVKVNDGNGGTDTATLQIDVLLYVPGGMITVCDSDGFQTADSSFSISNTGPAGNYLIIGVSSENGEVSSMSYNGAGMTRLHHEDTTIGYLSFFGLATSTASGTVTLNGVFTSGPRIYGVAYLDGVDTASPITAAAGFGRDSGTGFISLDYGTAGAGDFAVLAAYKNSNTSLSVTPSDVELIDEYSTASFSGLVAYDQNLTAGSYNSTFILSGGQRESAAGLILKALPDDGPNIDGLNGVNLADFAILSAQWQNPCGIPDWCGGADINKSGTVDLTDLIIVVQNWMQ